MNRVCSSDYIKAKKQNAIYTELQYNSKYTSPHTVNPVKKNGLTYNDNISILLNKNCSTLDCSGGQLNHAKNYDLLYDFNQGKTYNYNRCLCNKDITLGNCQAESGCVLLGQCCKCFTCAFK